MTNDDLKRFYPTNTISEKKCDFVRYDENGNLPSSETAIKSVVITSPDTATNGNLTQAQLNTLLEHELNYIKFANEIYRLSDNRLDEGYLIYSHACHDNTNNFYLKMYNSNYI